MQWSDVVAPPPAKILRQFAVLCLVVFGMIAAVGAWRGTSSTVMTAIAAGGLLTGAVGVVRPQAIRWIYSGWMIAVFPIGWTISRLTLAVLFYLVFTPIGLVFRLLRRDALRRREPGATSLWEPKPAARSSEEYFRQF
jgi:TRAP-type C4-dicarboxylate transport system permease small subunit